MPLFERLRDALGERRALIDVPAHVLNPPADYDDGFSLVLLGLYFSWDFVVLTDADVVIFVSHDEYGFLAEPIGKGFGGESAAWLRNLGVLHTV